jgi:hypothetical protein
MPQRLERLRSSGREAQGEKPEVPWKRKLCTNMLKALLNLIKNLRRQKPCKDKKDRLGKKYIDPKTDCLEEMNIAALA